ncbi:hypothetical protein CASFOL_006823 [Castilleja foliolosa]|uniref:F-box domain-containing protein n=1 Tax=Castilleja foliolosa TaxID=1961234 RepID=A0ABD3E7H2_9LAMI
MKNPNPNPNISTNTSSAQIVDSIDDILIQILLRLPLKPIYQFKSVSKHWQSLISSPEFRLIRSLAPVSFSGLIFQRFKRSYVVDFNIPRFSPFKELKFSNEPNREMKILNSCRGLLLCFDSCKSYYICNPTTNKYSKIPNYVDPNGWIVGMCLAFDPSKSPHYRVLCVIGWGISTLTKVFKIYSSETGSWRKCGDPRVMTDIDDFSNGVYWNGSIHWISKHKSGESIYFNIDDYDNRIDSSFKVMPTPPIIRGHGRFFGESCDHLHYVNLEKTGFSFFGYDAFDVYEMRRDYSEWFVKYKVDIRSALRRDLFDDVSLYALVRGKDDEDKGSFLVLKIEKRFVRYNIVSRSLETIYEFDGVGNCRMYLNNFEEPPLQYIESLYSV